METKLPQLQPAPPGILLGEGRTPGPVSQGQPWLLSGPRLPTPGEMRSAPHRGPQLGFGGLNKRSETGQNQVGFF